jgi:integrase
MPRVPRLCYHKAQGRYYLTLHGQEHYYPGGPTPRREPAPKAVRDWHDRVLAEYLRGRSARPPDLGTDPDVAEVTRQFRAHLDRPHAFKHGSNRRRILARALADLDTLCGGLPAREFGPLRLAELRADWVARGWGEAYLRKQVRAIVQCFTWASGAELFPSAAAVAAQLRDLAPLSRGELTAAGVRPPRRVPSADPAAVEAVADLLPAPLRALARAHRWIGCRAGEIVRLRAGDLDASAPCWRWTLEEHKTDRRREPLRYWVGPQAQAVLAPLLDRASPDAWLFSPDGSGTRRYSPTAYRTAVWRACNAAVGRSLIAPAQRWSPLQLRHLRLTEVRAWGGAEAAQAVASHRSLSTTEVYAERSQKLALDVVLATG